MKSRLKYVSAINSRVLGEYTKPGQEIRYIDIGSVTQEGFEGSYQDFTFDSAPSRARRKLSKGSTIVATVRTYLKAVAYFEKPESDVVVSTGFAVVDPIKEKLDPRYLYYRLVSDSFVQEVEARSTGVSYPAINPGELGEIEVEYPDSIKEQQRIAALLDHKIAAIDAVIAKKKQLRVLLQRQKTTWFTQLITKGIKQGVDLKYSNIGWMGQIPSHWEVRRLKTLATIKRGASPRPIDDPIYFDSNGEYSWVRIADVTRQGKYLLDAPQKLSLLGKSLSVPLEPGELFLSIAATVGKPMITKIKCCIHDGFIYFRNPKIDREYLYYIFAVGETYKGLGKLGTQLNLNSDTVGNIHIPLPPPHEQKQIVAKINALAERFGKTQTTLQDSIRLLEEYRASLISNAVSGKIGKGEL